MTFDQAAFLFCIVGLPTLLMIGLLITNAIDEREDRARLNARVDQRAADMKAERKRRAAEYAAMMARIDAAKAESAARLAAWQASRTNKQHAGWTEVQL
jgi:hypothetical protein